MCGEEFGRCEGGRGVCEDGGILEKGNLKNKKMAALYFM